VTPVYRSVIWLACLSLLGVLLGCNRTKTSTSSEPPPGPSMMAGPPAGFDVDSGPFAAGKKVFVAHGCFRCHSIGGIGGSPTMGGPPPGRGPNGPPMAGGPPPGPGGPGGMMGRNKGPDLAKVGEDPAHTVDWLMEHIRNPKAHKPKSRMPSFEGKIKDDDLRALAEYLASLK
jgi:cytochrome c2